MKHIEKYKQRLEKINQHVMFSRVIFLQLIISTWRFKTVLKIFGS